MSLVRHAVAEEGNIRPYSLLFVYGSLLSNVAHPMGDRLRGEAKLIGAAVMQGRLYTLSWYPAAVASDDPSDYVIGEVYQLDNPIHSLGWLDEYEGIIPAQSMTKGAEYSRVERSVRVARGGNVMAWVYLYQGDVTRLARITSGRWAP
jgi:gamma-glutamylcyclotransferase (GGCT)/AIG2-like uncharacterized protein YtfP